MPAFSVSATRRQSLPTIADRPFEEIKGLLRKSDVVVSDENIPPYKGHTVSATVPSSPTRATTTESPLTPKANGHVPPPLVLPTRTSAKVRIQTQEMDQKRSIPLLNRPIPKSFYEAKRPEGVSVFTSTLAATAPAPIIAITPAPGSSVAALPALLPPKPAFYNATGVRSFNSLDHLHRLDEESEEGHSETHTTLPTIVTTSSSTETFSTSDVSIESATSTVSPSSRSATPSPTSPSATSLSTSSTPTPSPTSKRKSLVQSVLRPIKSATDIMSLAKNSQGTTVSTPSSGTSTPRSSTPTPPIRSSTPSPSAVAQALSSAVRAVSSVAHVSSTQTATKRERSTLRPSTSDGTINESTASQRFKWRSSWVGLPGVKKEPSD